MEDKLHFKWLFATVEKNLSMDNWKLTRCLPWFNWQIHWPKSKNVCTDIL